MWQSCAIYILYIVKICEAMYNIHVNCRPRKTAKSSRAGDSNMGTSSSSSSPTPAAAADEACLENGATPTASGDMPQLGRNNSYGAATFGAIGTPPPSYTSTMAANPLNRGPDVINLVTPSPTGSANAALDPDFAMSESRDGPESERHVTDGGEVDSGYPYIDFQVVPMEEDQDQILPSPPPLTSVFAPPRANDAAHSRTSHTQNILSDSGTSVFLPSPYRDDTPPSIVGNPSNLSHLHVSAADHLRNHRDRETSQHSRRRRNIIRSTPPHRVERLSNLPRLNDTIAQESEHLRSRVNELSQHSRQERNVDNRERVLSDSLRRRNRRGAVSNSRMLALHQFLFDNHVEAIQNSAEALESAVIEPRVPEPLQSVDITTTPLASRPTDGSHSTSPHNEHSYSLVGQLAPDASNDVRVTEHSYSLASIGAMEAPPPLYHRHNGPSTGLRRSNRISARLGPRLGPTPASNLRVMGRGAVTGNATELSRTGTASRISTPAQRVAASGDPINRVNRSRSGAPLSVSTLAIVRVPGDRGAGEAEGRDGGPVQFEDDEASYTITFHAIRAEPSEGSAPVRVNTSGTGAVTNAPTPPAQSREGSLPGVNSNPLNVRPDTLPESLEGRNSDVRNPGSARPVVARTTVQGIFGPFTSHQSSMQFLSDLTSAGGDPLPSTTSSSAAAGGPSPDDEEGMVADYVRTVNREAEILNQSLEFIDHRSRARRNRSRQASTSGLSTLRVPPAFFAHELGSLASGSGGTGIDEQPNRMHMSFSDWQPMSLTEFNRHMANRMSLQTEGVTRQRHRSARARPQTTTTAQSHSNSGSIPSSSSSSTLPNSTTASDSNSSPPWLFSGSSSDGEGGSHTMSIPYQNLVVVESGSPAAAESDVIVVDSDTDEVCTYSSPNVLHSSSKTEPSPSPSPERPTQNIQIDLTELISKYGL